MRVAQRELKVKVTADIDKSLTKLLDSLKRKTTYTIKVNVKQDSLNKAKKTLDGLGKKSTINVKTNVNSKSLTKLNNDLEKIGNSKKVASVDVKVQDGGLGQLQKELNEAERKAEEVSNARISPIGVAAGLAPLASTLDQISDKILQISQQTIAPAIGETFNESMGLFDAQKSFELQMDSIGKNSQWIADQTKALNEYGKQSKYSVAEMTEAFGNYYAAGNEDAMDLVKGIAGISSYAKNASSAMKSVNTQIRQMTDDSKVFNGDWNRIENAVGGAAMSAIKKWLKVNKGFEYSKKALSEGTLEARDLKDAIIAVGNEDRFQKMATNVSTVSTAMDNLKESLVTSLVGDSIDPGPLRDVFESMIGIIQDFADEVPNFTKDIANGVEFLKDTFGAAFKDFSAKDFLRGLKESFEGVAPTIKLVADLIGKLTNNGKDTGKVIGNLIKFAAAWKLLRGLSKHVAALGGAGKTLVDVAKSMASIKGGGFLGKLFGGMGAGSKGSKGFNAKAIKGQALNAAKNIAIIAGVMATVWAGAKTLESISKMEIDWGSLGSNLSATAVGLTAAGGYMAVIGTALEKIKGLKQSLIAGAGAVAGVSAVLLAVTKAIELTSKIKINDKNLVKNLAVMAATLTLAGGSMFAIGTVLTKFPQAALALAAGAAALIGISGSMALVAKFTDSTVKTTAKTAKRLAALKSIKLEDVTSGLVKIAEITAAFGALGVAQISAGALSALGGLSSTIGNLAQSLNIDSLVALVNKISKVSVPSSGNLVGKIKSLVEAMAVLAGFNQLAAPANIISGLTSLTGFLGALGNTAQTLNITSLETLLSKLNSFKVPKDFDITTKLGTLQTISDSLATFRIETFANDILSFVSGFSKLAGNIGNVSEIKSIDSLMTLINKLNKIKVPNEDQVEKMQKKLESLKKVGEAIKGDSHWYDGIVSGFTMFGKMATAVGKSLDATNLSQTIAPFEKLVSFVGNLNKMPKIDATAINGKLKSLKTLSEKFSNFKLSKGSKDVSKDLKTFVENLSKITESLAKISEAGDLSNVGNTLTQVNTAMASITPIADSISSMNLPKGSKKKTSNLSDIVKSISSITKSLAKISEIGDLSALEPSLTALQTNIDKIKPVIEKLAGLKLAKGSKNKVDSISDIVTSIKTIADTLNSFPEVPDISPRIKSITKALNALTSAQGDSKISLFSFVETLGKDAKGNKLEDLVTFINDLATIANNLIALPEVPDLTAKFTSIQNALEKIKALQTKLAGDGKGGFAEGLKNAGKNISLESMVNTVNQLVKIANSLILIPEVPDMTAKIASIQNALTKIKGLQTALAGGENSAFAGGMVNAEKSMSLSSMVNTVNQIIQIANALVLIPEVPDVTAKIQSVKNAVLQIKSLQTALAGDSKGGFAEGLANKGNSISLEGMITQAQNVTSLVNAINAIPEVAEGITEKINAIKEAIKSLMSIGTAAVADAEGGSPVAGLQALLAQVNSILGQLKALTGQFQSTGTSYAQSLVNGFTSGGLERIPAKMNEIKAQLDGMADLTAIGRKMSDTLASGFDAKGLINQINDIQAAIDSLKGKTVTITIKEVKQKAEEHTGGMIAERYNGGQIPEYHSTGGRVGERMKGKLSWFTGNRASGPSTDTVPAMLTPGEYVLKRSVANALGKGFLDALNTMNLNSAMAHLQNKVAGNVTNNTYNNITQNVDNKASYLNGLGSIRRVVRS